jgi:hypothetical protein
MRKHMLLTLVVTTMLIMTYVLVSADTKEKPKNKKKTIEVVNLNILHGFACDPPMSGDGDQCRVRDRIDLLAEHLIAAGCPDIVTLQEHVTVPLVALAPPVVVGPLEKTVTLLQNRLPDLEATCGFRYEVVFDPEGATGPPGRVGPGYRRGTDADPLCRPPGRGLPTLQPAPLFFRHVLFARIDHAVEPVDVFTTHLAADSDFGSLPCGASVLPSPFESPSCPEECLALDTVRECEAKQLVQFIEAKHDLPGPAIVTGDFNAAPGSNVYSQVVSRGWIDSHLAAGNPECDPTTGLDCTAGRIDNNLSDLESPDLNQTERIDFIFVVPPEADSQ